MANLDSVVRSASCVLNTGDMTSVVLEAGTAQEISLLDAAAFDSDATITLSCVTSNGSAAEGVLEALEVEIPLQ